jgi:phosphoribosyl-ATP pyrophosphohydrolase/phosphoribosyl-AMP cyclohydrolase
MNLNFEKGGGLIPAIIQDASDGTVLMLGYMNEEALSVTRDSGRVTFYSRSKQRLWTKGETSGHWLEVVEIGVDCDRDALLVLVRAHGPTCHTGSRACFAEQYSFKQPLAFLQDLQEVITDRGRESSTTESYTARLLAEGPKRIAQKVGEEAVELALEAVGGESDALVGECADLMYHLMVLLESRDLSLGDVATELRRRHEPV